MTTSDTPREEGEGEKKDALDEWVDELDRLIGIEPMSEEEIAAQQQGSQKKSKGPDPLLLVVAAIVILAVVAVLFYLKIL